MKHKRNDLDSPRIKFNQGYHDAYMEYHNGWARTPVEHGEQSRTQVTRDFNPWYFEGYWVGIQDWENGDYCNDSSPAWLNYLDRRSPGERAAIHHEIYLCERDGLSDCLSRPVDAYIVERAEHYAARAMER